MIGEYLVSRFSQPGNVPELEGVAQIVGKLRKKFREQRQIAAERGRKLEQDRTQSPGGAQRIDRFQEQLGGGGSILQLLNMRDSHVRLGREKETGLRGFHPGGQRTEGRQALKSI